MDSIIELFTLTLKIAVLGGFVLLLTKFVKFKKFSSAKADIQNLQAKLSQLRMALKGKVKRKANVFRSSFKSGISEGDMIDNALRDLTENPFETSHDFQEYFDLSRRIVSFIQAESGEPNNNSSIENDFMCSELKTEMEIVRFIKDMSDISAKINSRIEEFNKTNTPTIPKVDSLVFSALSDINRIFKSDSGGDSDSFNKAS